MATPAVVTESPAPVAAAPKKAPPAKRKPAAKVAKKAAAPKASKKAAPVATEDTRQITPLIKATANPCKVGSFCFAQVLAAVSSKTVAEARRKLASDGRNPTKSRALELGWLVKKKFVKVGS